MSVAMTLAENSKRTRDCAYNRAYGAQRGISIGLFNSAAELFGIQIGILNYREEQPEISPASTADKSLFVKFVNGSVT